MAFNNWDKLSKAQRDYPKPKFAVAVVDKALKKNPQNVFLKTWRADLSLQQNDSPKLVITRLCVEATRRAASRELSISTVGTELLKPWQNTAKALERKTSRLELWDTLFNAAMREDCWEDVRFAVVNYNKEGPPSKKLAHYTHILTVQLAAEQQNDTLNRAGQLALIQYGLARKLMKQAYEASPDDPIAVKDIRDLRFMADIYGRQDRCAELFALWDNPPTALEDLMKTHRRDLMSLKTRLLRRREDWLLLESHCVACIEDTISCLKLAQDSKPLWELCAWRSDLWEALCAAVDTTRPGIEGMDKVTGIMNRCFGAGFQAKDRPLRLTYMNLRQFTGVLRLSDCKDYWEYHSQLPCCFADLRLFVQDLSVEDQKNFKKFIGDQTRGIRAKSSIDRDAFERWQQAELNVLKFDYLLTIALPKSPTYQAMEYIITKAINACAVCPGSPDGGFLAIYALLHLHHQVICREDEKVPFEITPNSRILLQATMLARHLVSRDKNKENRALSLLAARLHLNLGLGKCAFQLYHHTKCKEMLVDTLSPYVLSRISLTHPFDILGYQGFSADEELAKVISTIERMEKKTDSYLYVDMPSFVWDQASDALDLKRKLRSSLTKHICITERRRIARLRGEPTENIPRLDYKTFTNISDNVDRSVFPNWEGLESVGPLSFVMPNAIPNTSWMIASVHDWGLASRMLYREEHWYDFDAWVEQAKIRKSASSYCSKHLVPAERQLIALWTHIFFLTLGIHRPGAAQRVDGEPQALRREIHMICKAMEKLRMPGSTVLKPEDEPTMFHENMLISCYTKLEALRAVNKLIEHLRQNVTTPKSTHPLKAKLPDNWVSDLVTEMQICYEAIRDVARSYINLIRERGVAAIKAQVKWGITGEALMDLLKDDDVEYYAKEYVDSALEAWNGVLKVKLQ